MGAGGMVRARDNEESRICQIWHSGTMGGSLVGRAVIGWGECREDSSSPVTGSALTERRRRTTSADASLSDNSPSCSPSTMLSRVSTKSGKALCRSALRSSVSRVHTKDARRSFVQPSGADRASVVDIPSAYQEDTAFSPRVDMFGFKLESSRREGGPSEKARPIYLDMQATTPVDPRVLDAMLPYLTDRYGNPHSRTHAYGWEAEKAVEDARKHVADLIGADPKDIVFTSGATETNNMAIKGVARFHKERKRHVITTQTEHKCVLDSCRKLQEEGFDVTYLPVQKNGVINLEELEAAIRPDTTLVSIMTVNNETGVIQPMKEIGQIVRKHRGVYLHTDAAQAAGKINVDVNEMNVDLMSLSGHKLYGPKGVGAAYVRRRPRVRLEPILSGGGQERGLRSGTLPTALAVGMGEAARIAKSEMAVSIILSSACLDDTFHANHITMLGASWRVVCPADGTASFAMTLRAGVLSIAASEPVAHSLLMHICQRDHARVKGLSDRLINGINSRVEHVIRNGDPNGYPGCVNLSFAYVEGESLLMALKDIALSSGSACTSASLEPSYVLRALGAAEDMAHSSLRFGIGRFTTEAEIDYVVEKIVAVVQRLRDMSPLWEMVQEGIDINSIDWSQH
ncbi:pyridoxal phosphate-dependent transferase [Daedaleopsis nitida]|nr:pyridoxal phosphate-dependent transferase [Daedaleopsis nitida]